MTHTQLTFSLVVAPCICYEILRIKETLSRTARNVSIFVSYSFERLKV